MTHEQIAAKKAELYEELAKVAAQNGKLPNRMCRMEELHKRLNALIRYENEVLKVSAPVA